MTDTQSGVTPLQTGGGNFGATTFDVLTGQRMGLQPGVTWDTEGSTDKSKQPGKRSDSVILSEQLLIQYRSLSLPWRRQVVDDRDFVAGAQFTRRRRRLMELRGQTPIVVDCISPAVEQAVALLTANTPRFSATGREDSDVRIAKLFADILTFIWELNRGNTLLKQTIKDYYIASIGWMCAYFDPDADYGRGEIKLRSLDPLHVYVDPMAKEFFYQDAAHIIVTSTLNREQISIQYPELMQQIAGKMWQSYGEQDTIPSEREGGEAQGSLKLMRDRFSTKYDVIDRYSRVKVAMYHAYEPKSGYEKVLEIPELGTELSKQEYEEFMSQQCFIEQRLDGTVLNFVDPRSVSDAQKLYQQMGGIFHIENDQNNQPQFVAGDERAVEGDRQQFVVPGSTTQLTPTTMAVMIRNKVVDFRQTYVNRIQRTFSVGGVLIWEDLMPLDIYPLVPLIFDFDRTPYPMSAVRRVKGMQEYVNNMRTMIVAHASAVANMKVAYPTGSFNEKDLIQKLTEPGIGIIPYDPELGTMTVLQPAALASEIYKNESDGKADIDRILGLYPMQQGDPGQTPNTYRGMLALDEFGQRRIKTKQDDVEEFLSTLGKVVIQLMQNYYTDYKVIRLLRPNDQTSVIAINTDKAFNPDDITANEEFRINDISTGKYDIIVVSGSMLPSNRYALAEYYTELYKLKIIDQEEVLKKTEVADIEGVLKRTSILRQMEQQIQQLTMQVKQLSGDNQTLQRENVTAQKKVEVMKFATDLDKSKNKAQAAAELYNARLDDSLKAQKEKERLTRKAI